MNRFLIKFVQLLIFTIMTCFTSSMVLAMKEASVCYDAFDVWQQTYDIVTEELNRISAYKNELEALFKLNGSFRTRATLEDLNRQVTFLRDKVALLKSDFRLIIISPHALPLLDSIAADWNSLPLSAEGKRQFVALYAECERMKLRKVLSLRFCTWRQKREAEVESCSQKIGELFQSMEILINPTKKRKKTCSLPPLPRLPAVIKPSVSSQSAIQKASPLPPETPKVCRSPLPITPPPSLEKSSRTSKSVKGKEKAKEEEDVSKLSTGKLIGFVNDQKGGLAGVSRYLEQLKKLASLQNAEAQFFLGCFYADAHCFNGGWIYKDLEQAEIYLDAYIKNRQKTDSEALFMLGIIRAEKGNDDVSALELIIQAIGSGYPIKSGHEKEVKQINELCKRIGQRMRCDTWFQALAYLCCGFEDTCFDKILVLLESLSIARHIHVCELVGFEYVTKFLKKHINDDRAVACLLRLNIVCDNALTTNIGERTKARFIQNSDKIQNPSMLVLMGFLYEHGLFVEKDSIKAIQYMLRVLERSSPHSIAYRDAMSLLEQRAQILCNISFQATEHEADIFLGHNGQTQALLMACYGLVPFLIDSNTLLAARLFIAAEHSAVAEKDFAFMPEGIAAFKALQEYAQQRNNLDISAALIFSFARRYMANICHERHDMLVDLKSLKDQFVRDVTYYFENLPHDDTQRALVVGFACNMYCILGCQLGNPQNGLVHLMREVVRICPPEYWFFKYNLAKLGVYDALQEDFDARCSAMSNDKLLSCMLIDSPLYKKRGSSWCCLLPGLIGLSSLLWLVWFSSMT